MKFSLLQQQHTVLKFIFILMGLFYAFVIKDKVVMILLGCNLLFFLFDLTLFKAWLYTLNKASSFVMSYLIFALIIDIDFSLQISFLLRIMYLLQLSVYLTKTSNLHHSINDLRFLLKYVVLYEVFYFITALTSSMSVLSHIWDKHIARIKKEKFQLQNYINVLVITLEEGFAKLSLIEKQVSRVIKNTQTHKSEILTSANLLLAYQFVTYILAISL